MPVSLLFYAEPRTLGRAHSLFHIINQAQSLIELEYKYTIELIVKIPPIAET